MSARLLLPSRKSTNTSLDLFPGRFDFFQSREKQTPRKLHTNCVLGCFLFYFIMFCTRCPVSSSVYTLFRIIPSLKTQCVFSHFCLEASYLAGLRFFRCRKARRVTPHTDRSFSSDVQKHIPEQLPLNTQMLLKMKDNEYKRTGRCLFFSELLRSESVRNVKIKNMQHIDPFRIFSFIKY